MNPPTKPRFARHVALPVSNEILEILKPVCERVIVAGSLRRGKQWVGDVEILYIGKQVTRPKNGDLFAMETVSLADLAIADLLTVKALEKRPNKLGAFTWGDQNKLALHVRSGVPVDLFAATAANWWNYLVCRTGSASHNVTIATRAKQIGWTWNPYGSGFTKDDGSQGYTVESEADLFRFLNIQFVEPQDR
jgi:DNA polymerase/3'-5' exonuclease PolX